MPDLTELSDAARKLALERYRKLQPHLEQNLSLLQVARDAALPIRTARRWVQRYKSFGLAGLTRRGRADHGKRRSIGPELHHFAEGLALQKPPITSAAVHREVCKIALRRGERLPGYHSVCRVGDGGRVLPVAEHGAFDAVSPITPRQRRRFGSHARVEQTVSGNAILRGASGDSRLAMDYVLKRWNWKPARLIQ